MICCNYDNGVMTISSVSLPGIRLRPNYVSKGDKSIGIVGKLTDDDDGRCGYCFVDVDVDVDEFVLTVSVCYAIGTEASEMAPSHDKLTP